MGSEDRGIEQARKLAAKGAVVRVIHPANGLKDSNEHLKRCETQEEIDSAYETLKKMIDSATPILVEANKFAKVDAKSTVETAASGDWVQKLLDMVERRNLDHFVAVDGGRCCVIRERYDVGAEQSALEFMAVADFKNLYRNNVIKVGENRIGDVHRGIGQAWFEHEARRTYPDGITFLPGLDTPPSIYNLWQGYGVEPKQGSCRLFMAFLHDVICDGNEAHYRYLLNWLARMVQVPGEPGEVAVVLKSTGKGTGKGTFGRTFSKIMGRHGMHLSNQGAVTGRFNEHFRDCVFCFADEAFFAGSKSDQGELKRLVTEDTLSIEPKFRGRFQVRNCIHLMMASNEDWVVPTSFDERRWFVLEVSEARKQDTAYFGAIMAELKAGGYEALLFDLLNRDISSFNHRAVPITAALREQTARSLRGFDAWWHHILCRGYLLKSNHSHEYIFSEWIEEVSNDLAYESYIRWTRETNDRHPESIEILGRFLTKHYGPKKKLHDLITGENRDGCVRAKSGLRKHGRNLGSLEEAKSVWTAKTGMKFDDDDD